MPDYTYNLLNMHGFCSSVEKTFCHSVALGWDVKLL
jgi:hypothetical protein